VARHSAWHIPWLCFSSLHLYGDIKLTALCLPLLVCAQALSHIQGSNPGRYQALMGGLDGGARQAVEAMMQHAAAEQAAAAAGAQ
jgi:hypothetical protein